MTTSKINGRQYHRLEPGETVQRGDFSITKSITDHEHYVGDARFLTNNINRKVTATDMSFYFREVKNEQ